jgi:acetyl-CoA carboxylase biotin carboxyl carrier protein
MKANEILELLNFIATSGLDEVDIQAENNLRISVKRHSTAAATILQALPAPVAAPVPVATSAPVAAAPAPAPAAVAPAPVAEAANIVIQKSPMIGTLYRSPSPDKPALVSVGDEVKKGQTICIIEAMKLFNEIECDFTGRIVEVLIENANPVEYDQPLFKIAVA